MEVLSSTQMRQEKIIEILHETLHAEHGSALEMLATSKNATKSRCVGTATANANYAGLSGTLRLST